MTQDMPFQRTKRGLSKQWHPATSLTLFAMAAFVLGAIVPVLIFAAADGQAGASTREALADPVIWRALRFTLWQAGLSTLLSISVALSFALYLHDQGAFVGRNLVLRLFALPMALPQIVAVLAIISLYGRNGLVSDGIRLAGLPAFDLYGLKGILLAHVFFNMPLAIRIILMALDRQPAEYRRIAELHAMTTLDRMRLLHWPMARASVAQAATLIFLLCVTSFTVVLTLGGGPRSTTLEVAIYQALTFDFNLNRAALLIGIQLTVTALAAMLVSRLGRSVDMGSTFHHHPNRKRARSSSWQVWLIIGLPVAFVASPFIVIAVDGVSVRFFDVIWRADTLEALRTSLVLGLTAGLLATGASWCLGLGLCRLASRAHTSEHKKHPLAEIITTAPSLVLVVPPLVLAAGWFLTLRRFTDPFEVGAIMIVTINALMALPFASRLLVPAMLTENARHDRICQQLGLNGWHQFRQVQWPVLRWPLLSALGFGFAYSLGDVSVVALYGSRDLVTLPSLILQNMGSYRSDDAQILALILCVTTALIMFLADGLQDRKANQQ